MYSDPFFMPFSPAESDGDIDIDAQHLEALIKVAELIADKLQHYEGSLAGVLRGLAVHRHAQWHILGKGRPGNLLNHMASGDQSRN
jgi:hypothetical protein